MHQINRDKPRPNGWKTGKPCKMIYVGKGIALDSRHIQEFKYPHPEKYSREKTMIQDALGMPSLRSPDVPPNHETGNTYKPYVYIDGEIEVDGDDLTVEIGTRQKSIYKNGEITAPFKGDFVCKIVMDGYASKGAPVGKKYVELGIFHTSSQTDNKGRAQCTGAVSEKTMNNICKSVFSLCEKSLKGMFGDGENSPGRHDTDTPKKKTKEKLSFRLLVLPDSAKNSPITHEKPGGTLKGKDSFGNDYTEIPSSVHKSATYATIDDMAYMLNPTSASKEPEELVRYWGSHPVIGNKTFEKIGMNLDSDFYGLAGFRWYFGSHDTKFTRERHARDDGTEEVGPYRGKFRHGIWHQLYEGMKQAGSSDRPGSGMVVLCVKKLNIARIEIVLSELVSVASLRKSLLVNGVPLGESEFQDADAHDAMEEALLNPGTSADKKPDWSMYMECVADILGGRKTDRGRLVRHITANFRERYTREKWKLVKNKKKAARFFGKVRFAISALASPHDRNEEMDSAEEYAHRMGRLVGAYAKFAKLNNMVELELQPGTRCDANMLRKTFVAVTKKLSLLKGAEDLNGVILDVKRHMPSKELEPREKKRDLTLHFYMGLFREL